MTNDEKVERLRKRKILYYLIIVFGVATLFLAILSLTEKITPLFALITFLVEAILSKWRDKLKIKVEDPDSKN